MDEFQQSIIDALNRLAAAFEVIGKNIGGEGGEAKKPKKAGRKQGAFSFDKPVRVDKVAKEWPNDKGWYKANVGGKWMATKSTSIADAVIKAYEDDYLVIVTYDQKQNGDYTNCYFATVAPADGSAASAPQPPLAQQKPAAAPSKSDDDDAAPF